MIVNHSEKRDQSPILNILVFFYVLSVFTLNSIPVFSKVDFFISIIIAFYLFFKFVITGYLNIPRLIWLPWVFFMFAMYSIIWAYNPDGAFQVVIALFTIIMSACILWTALENGASIKSVIKSMVLSATIIVLSTVYEILFSTEEYLDRYTGILNNPNLLAILLSIIGIMIIGLYSHKKGAILFSLTIITFATIYSGSRKIAFTWLILCFVLLLKSKYKVKITNLFFMLFAGLFTLLLIIYYSTELSQFFGNLNVVQRYGELLSGTDQNSADVRSIMIIEGIQFWQNHLWIGNGVGQFSELSIYGQYSHNNYIESLSGLGIVGFLLYYSIYFYLFLKSIKLMKQKGKGAITSLSIIILFLLWEIALVSYIEQFTWLALAVLFYITAERKDVWQIKKYN